jgi:hypothetical protein
MVEEKFKLILENIKKQDLPVTLFALLKMDELVDRWSVLFSSPGLEDKEVRDSVFETIISLLDDTLDTDLQDSIVRVGVFPINEHLVQGMLKYKTGTHIQGPVRINGNYIHEAYIFESCGAGVSDAGLPI